MGFHITAAQIQRRNEGCAEGHAVFLRVIVDDLEGFYRQFAVRVILSFGAAEEKVIGNFDAGAVIVPGLLHEGIQRRSGRVQALLLTGKTALFIVKQRLVRLINDALKLLFIGQNQRGVSVIQSENAFILYDTHGIPPRVFSSLYIELHQNTTCPLHFHKENKHTFFCAQARFLLPSGYPDARSVNQMKTPPAFLS